MTTSRLSSLLLGAALLSGSISVVPLLPVVLVAATFHFGALALLTKRGMLVAAPVRWFLLYMVVSFAYASLIGVDLADPSLYRREFKYFIPFSAFVIFSSLRYSSDVDRTVRRALLFLGAANLLLLAASPILAASGVLDGMYADRGNIWQPYGPLFIYLGPFLSHSGAGAWFGVMALVCLGISTVPDLPTRTRALFKGFGILFLFLILLALSRAYLVASALVLLHVFVGGTLRRKTYLVLALFGVVIAAGTLVPYLGSRVVTSSLVTLGDAESTAEYNVLARYVLWGKAVEDFVESPLIGVGVSRFDDELRVIATFPTEVDAFFRLGGEPQYFRAPLVRVNVGSAQVHTDQQAHNMFLHILAEGGLMMFGLMVTMILSMVTWLRKVQRVTRGFRAGVARGTSWGLYAVLVSAFFGNGFFTVTPMFFLLSLAGYLNSVTAEGTRTALRTPGPPIPS